MDALTDKKVKVYFGGGYREKWTPDYTMSVEYYDRTLVEAVYTDGVWTPTDGDSELIKQLCDEHCPELTQKYFRAAAEVYAAARDCAERGLPLERIYESYYFEGNELAAPELMRLLMDDCGLSINLAYFVCANACGELYAPETDIMELYKLQPRTANVLSLLRRTPNELMIAIHDARLAKYRQPFGAVCCGEEVMLCMRVVRGREMDVTLIVYGDDCREEYPMARDGEWLSATFTAPDEPKALWYCFRIETAESSHWVCPDRSGYFGKLCGREESGFRLTVYDRDFDTPEWFRKSVMYQIFPDRFGFSEDGTSERGIEYHRALGQRPQLHASIEQPVRWQPREFEKEYVPDDFYGGTFKGIEGKLDYLKGLGVSCLYLNPIVEARSNHRYDASDYHRPDPILGSMEDFEALCAAAESRGIRIILDGVFSHTGADSRYFDRYGNYGGHGACAGTESEFYDWYDFKSFPDKYRCWWGFEELPEVNENNPKWQRDIITGEDSVVKSWLRHGAAGWRLDVADELPDPVIELIRTEAKRQRADAPIIGEVWEDAVIKESYGSRRSYALGRALDSVMNYPFRRAVLDFALGKQDAYALCDFLTGQQMNYPKPMYYALMNLLGSHDVERLRSALACETDIRSLSREAQVRLEFSEEKLNEAIELEKLCAAIQFAIPGVPSIYYGDEQGMCGACDPFNRMPFREDVRELHDWYARLAEVRNANDALSTGEVRFFATSKDILVILRYIKDGADAFGRAADNAAFAVAINRGERARFTLDCKVLGMSKYHSTVEARTAKTIRLA